MNARLELLQATENLVIVCASITHGCGYGHTPDVSKMVLKVGHTPEELGIFMASLEFEYDAGYGGQELYGTVLCEDGVWLDRGEYDGSEWWNIHSYPSIPEECLEGYKVGEEVVYLTSDNMQRTGTIESINEKSVSICMLDGSLYIGPLSVILFSLDIEDPRLASDYWDGDCTDEQ